MLVVDLSKYLKSYPSYTIKCASGGDVYGTTIGGTFFINPDKGNCGVANGKYYIDENVALSSNTNVTFEKNFNVASITAKSDDNSISGTVAYTARNAGNESNPRLAVALYDDSGKYYGCDIINTTPTDSSYNYTITHSPDNEKNYILKAMLISEELKALSPFNQTNVQ